METNTLRDEAPSTAQGAVAPEASQTNAVSSTAAAGTVMLRLVNQSNDTNNSQVVIFQKNVVTDFSEIAVAWKVIQNLGQGWSHSFTYPPAVEASVLDAWGNTSPALPIHPGERADVVRTSSGNALQLGQPASNPQEIEVGNSLPQGAISASILRDARPVATLTGIAPGQKAAFQFKPSLYIGVVSQVEEGEVMDSAILSEVNTELSLLGIASADIVMTGGGAGPNAQPFQFTLQNVVMA